jgi:cyanophycinase
MRRILPAAALLLAAACTSAAPSTGPVPDGTRGHLLIVGGGSQPPALVSRFVELAGGPRARIAVVPMASEEAEEGGREKAEQLRGLGAQAVVLNLTRAQAMGDSAVRMLEGVTGVWFNGGDQSRLTDALLGTPVLDAIHRRYRDGAVIGGTSAGAAIMSDSMLTGNQVAAGEDTIGYHGDEYPRVARGTIQVVRGMGFLPGTIVDQHFLRRERQNRLLSVVLERPSMLGVGIDESTAVVVRPDGWWEIIGASSVLVMDARQAQVTPPDAAVLGGTGIRMLLLPAGSLYDPRTGQARLPGG